MKERAPHGVVEKGARDRNVGDTQQPSQSSQNIFSETNISYKQNMFAYSLWLMAPVQCFLHLDIILSTVHSQTVNSEQLDGIAR